MGGPPRQLLELKTGPKRLPPHHWILVKPFPFLLRFLFCVEPLGPMNVFDAALFLFQEHSYGS